jgi:hypothetical protein
VADDRPHDLLLAAREAGELLDRHVEPRRLAARDGRLARPGGGAREGARDRLERGLLDRGALDEEDVQ